MSSSLFRGEVTRREPLESVPLSRPGIDTLDVFLSEPGRVVGPPVALVSRVLEGREGGALLPAAEETDDCRAALVGGRAGGPIDGLVAAIEGRVGFSPAEATRALDGVPVREFRTLEGAVAAISCFVGDFEGDYSPLRQ
jgi:class 3 adenylate cyclase